MRILHVEDSELDSAFVSDLLRRDGLDCEIVRVQTRQEFFDEVNQREFDLILSDCTLPRFSGLEALSLSHTLQPNTPFIFFSGTIGEELAIESLRRGARDYVLKDKAGRLASAIRRAIDETEQRKKLSELSLTLQKSFGSTAEQKLVSGISHHFNNILTIIIGHNALLAKYCAHPDKVLNTSAAIEEAANRGALVMQRLMAMAGQRDLEFSRVDFNQEIQEIVSEQSIPWPARVTIQMDLADRLPLIYVDRTQIRQVILNLLQNAHEALLREGKGEIDLTTRLVNGCELTSSLGLSPNESYLCLELTDTGMGMDDATMARAFDPFFTTKPKREGLGLSVVRGLVKAHRGAVDLWSKKGEGTTVSLFFPLSGTESKRRVSPSNGSLKALLSGSETILVVEDEEQLLNFLGIILRGQGYRPLLAKDPVQAMELFRAHVDEIQLVVTDVGLPEMDGFTLIGEMKKIRPVLDVLVVSGNQEANYREKIEELEVCQFLAKPYRTHEIMRSIRDILDAAIK